MRGKFVCVGVCSPPGLPRVLLLETEVASAHISLVRWAHLRRIDAAVVESETGNA